MSRPCGLNDEVNSIGNSALYCSKKFKGIEILNYPGKGKVTIIKRNYVSGRCPDTVNVDIGPVNTVLLIVLLV